jgi:hypothetical protein
MWAVMSGSVEPAIAGGKDWRAPWRRVRRPSRGHRADRLIGLRAAAVLPAAGRQAREHPAQDGPGLAVRHLVAASGVPAPWMRLRCHAM